MDYVNCRTQHDLPFHFSLYEYRFYSLAAYRVCPFDKIPIFPVTHALIMAEPSLTGLPIEVRTQIHQYLFCDALVWLENTFFDLTLKPRLWQPRSEILQVSRQLRAEALSLQRLHLVVHLESGIGHGLRDSSSPAIMNTVTSLNIPENQLKYFWSKKSWHPFPNLQLLIVKLAGSEIFAMSDAFGCPPWIKSRDHSPKSQLKGVLAGETDKVVVRSTMNAYGEDETKTCRHEARRGVKVLYHDTLLVDVTEGLRQPRMVRLAYLIGLKTC